MAESGETKTKSDWRGNLLSQLQNRNKQQCKCFEDLILYRELYNELFNIRM